MKEPNKGASVRIESHQATGRPPPSPATARMLRSAMTSTGRVEASAMMMTTNIGSV